MAVYGGTTMHGRIFSFPIHVRALFFSLSFSTKHDDVAALLASALTAQSQVRPSTRASGNRQCPLHVEQNSRPIPDACLAQLRVGLADTIFCERPSKGQDFSTLPLSSSSRPLILSSLPDEPSDAQPRRTSVVDLIIGPTLRHTAGPRLASLFDLTGGITCLHGVASP
ncbi:hypothetical protein BC629DRAFT_258733 [Irpex lacteus]|nr:hypothetical protein BC629DRAFT_258733 [Irpex lacteus]